MFLRRLIVVLLPTITSAHRWLVQVSGGRLGGSVLGFHFLQLENRGRRSGKLYMTPLLYVPDEGTFLVAASNAGQDHAPAWWLNLRESPDTAVQIGSERIAVTAERLAGEEEAEMWAKMQAAWPLFDAYRAGTSRSIPLVRLHPR